MHLLPSALHLTLQARYLHCSGCRFELKKLGFTAAYRARQRLPKSRNTFISILRAGLLQPHGSESGTWHNRDLIGDMHVLTHRRERVMTACITRTVMILASPGSTERIRDQIAWR
jgi:transcriptional regulator CtsR